MTIDLPCQMPAGEFTDLPSLSVPSPTRLRRSTSDNVKPPCDKKPEQYDHDSVLTEMVAELRASGVSGDDDRLALLLRALPEQLSQEGEVVCKAVLDVQKRYGKSID